MSTSSNSDLEVTSINSEVSWCKGVCFRDSCAGSGSAKVTGMAVVGVAVVGVAVVGMADMVSLQGSVRTSLHLSLHQPQLSPRTSA